MPRWFNILAIAAIFVGLMTWAAIAGINYFLSGLEFNFSRLDDSHRVARTEFYAALETEACLERDTIIDAAENRGFAVSNMDEFQWCHSPTDLTDWLRVDITPPQLLSTADENAAFFGFDEAGCSIPWAYASGEGTTCPPPAVSE